MPRQHQIREHGLLTIELSSEPADRRCQLRIRQLTRNDRHQRLDTSTQHVNRTVFAKPDSHVAHPLELVENLPFTSKSDYQNTSSIATRNRKVSRNNRAALAVGSDLRSGRELRLGFGHAVAMHGVATTAQ